MTKRYAAICRALSIAPATPEEAARRVLKAPQYARKTLLEMFEDGLVSRVRVKGIGKNHKPAFVYQLIQSV